MLGLLQRLASKLKPHEQSGTPEEDDRQVYCECGCGQQFPRSLVIARPTSYPGRPVEYLYVLHAAAVYTPDDPALPARINYIRNLTNID